MELHFSHKVCNSNQFPYALHFSQEMCNSNEFSIEVALFKRNLQVKPIFLTSCAFLKKKVQLKPIFRTSCTFLNKCATQTCFLAELNFSHEVCNSNRFSIGIEVFSRNVQLKPIFRTSCTFLKKMQLIPFHHTIVATFINVHLFNDKVQTISSTYLFIYLNYL
jgi:hypothetical protein